MFLVLFLYCEALCFLIESSCVEFSVKWCGPFKEVTGMANIKSAKKRVLTNEAKREKQQAFKSSMRSAVKEFYKKADSNDKEGAKELFVLAEKKLDKAAGKNIIHKNSASRQKSKMQVRLNELAQ